MKKKMKQSTPDEVETSKSSDVTMDRESKKDITNSSSEENEQETVEEDKEEEEPECGFCLFMKGGGCKDRFIAWENCVEEGEKNKEDIVEKCFEVTTLLKKCMEANADYYEPILKAEKAMEEEVSQTLEQESQSETTTTGTTSTTSEDKEKAMEEDASQTLEQESQSETTTTGTTSTTSEDKNMVQKTSTQDKQV